MKKNLFFAALAAIAFASCSSDDLLVDNSSTPENEVAIGFSSNDVDNATRANIDMAWMKTVDNTNGKFGVFGYKGVPGATGTAKIFDNEKVTYETKTVGGSSVTDWYHPNVRFWDKSAANKYNFFAYAPYAATASETNGVIEFAGLSIFNKITTDGVDDICLATPVTSTDYQACTHTGHVAFTFNHLLSKLAFQYKTTIASDVATIKIKKVEIQTPTGSDAKWSQTAYTGIAGTTTFTTYTTDGSYYTQYEPSTSKVLSSSEEVLGDQYIVVPVNTSKTSHFINIKVTYDIVYGSGESAVTDPDCVAVGAIKASNASDADDIAFAGNTFYTVTVIVNPATIEFDVTSVANWTTGSTGDVELQ